MTLPATPNPADAEPSAETDAAAVSDEQATDTTEAITAPEAVAEEPAEVVEASGALVKEVGEQNETAGAFLESLSSVAFETASFRVSLLDVLLVSAVILIVIVIAWLLTRFARNVIGRVTKFDSSQQLLAEKLSTMAIWALAFLIGMDLLGIDLTALAFFGGAFGLAIGFGLQKTFGNLISGILLLLDKSIKPGDVISVYDQAGNESVGQIRKIGIRAISVITRDQTEHLIPNENLMINQVVNWSYSSRDVRVKAPVGVSYGSDLVLVEKLLYQAVQETNRILKNRAARVNIMEFGDNSVNFELRFWIEDPEEGIANIRSDVYMRIWQLFKEHDIEIPFPQRDLNLRSNDQIDQLIAAISQRASEKVTK